MLSDVMIIFLEIPQDVNDNEPVFSSSSYTFIVTDTTTPGTAIGNTPCSYTGRILRHRAPAKWGFSGLT
jgi:hypothetical protein